MHSCVKYSSPLKEKFLILFCMAIKYQVYIFDILIIKHAYQIEIFLSENKILITSESAIIKTVGVICAHD